MKKFSNIIILLVIFIFTNCLEVKADEITMCEYVSKDETIAKIIYTPILKSDYMPEINDTPGKWSIWYKKSGDKKFKLFQNKSTGSFEEAFYTSDIISYKTDKGKIPESYEKEFRCPDYINIEYDGPWHRACFTDKSNNGLCSDNKTVFEFHAKLSTEADTFYNKINKFAEKGFFETYNINDLVEKFAQNPNYELWPLIKEKTKENFKNGNIFPISEIYAEPNFVKNIDSYIDNIDKYIESKDNDEYNKFLDKVSKKRGELLAEKMTNLTKLPNATPEEKEELEKRNKEIDKQLDNLETNIPETFYPPKDVIDSIEISDETTCSGILGKTVSNIVINIFNLVKFAGPILVAIFTIFDLIKAVLSGEADDMKKASNNLIKRLIFAVLLFFVPLIVQIGFELAGILTPSTCIIGS